MAPKPRSHLHFQYYTKQKDVCPFFLEGHGIRNLFIVRLISTLKFSFSMFYSSPTRLALDSVYWLLSTFILPSPLPPVYEAHCTDI